jgi:hypothetical protein
MSRHSRPFPPNILTGILTGKHPGPIPVGLYATRARHSICGPYLSYQSQPELEDSCLQAASTSSFERRFPVFSLSSFKLLRMNAHTR